MFNNIKVPLLEGTEKCNFFQKKNILLLILAKEKNFKRDAKTDKIYILKIK